jgi:hypothetical protein
MLPRAGLIGKGIATWMIQIDEAALRRLVTE